MLPPLLTTISFLLANSSIETFSNQHEGIVCYSCLIAQPSTGKTPAMNKIKRSLIKVENYFNVLSDDSQLTNGIFISISFDIV